MSPYSINLRPQSMVNFDLKSHKQSVDTSNWIINFAGKYNSNRKRNDKIKQQFEATFPHVPLETFIGHPKIICRPKSHKFPTHTQTQTQIYQSTGANVFLAKFVAFFWLAFSLLYMIFSKNASHADCNAVLWILLWPNREADIAWYAHESPTRTHDTQMIS